MGSFVGGVGRQTTACVLHNARTYNTPLTTSLGTRITHGYQRPFGYKVGVTIPSDLPSMHPHWWLQAYLQAITIP